MKLFLYSTFYKILVQPSTVLPSQIDINVTVVIIASRCSFNSAVCYIAIELRIVSS